MTFLSYRHTFQFSLNTARLQLEPSTRPPPVSDMSTSSAPSRDAHRAPPDVAQDLAAGSPGEASASRPTEFIAAGPTCAFRRSERSNLGRMRPSSPASAGASGAKILNMATMRFQHQVAAVLAMRLSELQLAAVVSCPVRVRCNLLMYLCSLRHLGMSRGDGRQAFAHTFWLRSRFTEKGIREKPKLT